MSSNPQITVAPRSTNCPRCMALTSIVAYHLPRINATLNSLRGTFSQLAFQTNSLEVSLSATSSNFNSFIHLHPFPNGSTTANSNTASQNQQHHNWPAHTPIQESPREGQEDATATASSTAAPPLQSGDVQHHDYTRPQNFYGQ